MRIVDVNEFYAPKGGGVRTYIDRKMGIMAELGHELIVIAPARADSVEQRPGGRIIWVKAPAMPFDSRYGVFWDREPVVRWLDELQPDLVEATSPWRPAWIVGEWQGSAVKAFFMHNDNMASYPYRWFEGVPRDMIDRAFDWYNRYMVRFLAPFDILVTNGPSLKKRLESRGIGPAISISLGIEREYFSPGLRDETLRAAILAECGLPPSAHLFIGVGRHHPEKRWPMIVDAVTAASTEHPIGLMLVGDGIDRRTIEKRVEGNPHIRLYKPVYGREEFGRILASADVMIHGSDAEPFGLVTSEGLASGLPLIVPDEGGAFELAHPDYAETYAAADARACADAILRLLGSDFAARKAAAVVAAASVKSDREHVVELMRLYQGLVDARRSKCHAHDMLAGQADDKGEKSR